MNIKRWHIFALIYLILLGLSWFVQIYFPVVEKPLAGEEAAEIIHNDSQIPIRYIRFHREDNRAELIVIPDIHFGPEFLIPFAKAIHRDHQKNVTIPFFPEVNTMDKRVSHSISSRAGYIRQLMEFLSVGEVDLAGHGYGGLVAINLASDLSDEATEIRSLTLLSSLGVVELQFLGNHSFNRAIYSFMFPLSSIIEWGFPHMGYYYLQPIQQSYARSLRQKDQRTVREQLGNIDIPVLILHPLQDKLASLSIAEENHRLLPQSYLLTHEGNEQIIFEDPEKWIAHLQWFLDGVEESDVTRRENAHMLRVELSEHAFDAAKMRSIGGGTLLILMLLLALFTLISEDIACISGGLIVATGVLPFWYAVLGCFIGSVISNIFIYLIGRKAGSPILYKKPVKWFIKSRDVEKAQNLFEMRGMEIIFVTRFIPGTRLPAYLVAGILKTKFSHFLGYFLLSLIIWIPMMVGIAALVGQPLLHYLELYQEYAIWIFLSIAVFIYLLIRLLIPLTTVTGRRRLIVRWGRFREKYFGATFERDVLK